MLLDAKDVHPRASNEGGHSVVAILDLCHQDCFRICFPLKALSCAKDAGPRMTLNVELMFTNGGGSLLKKQSKSRYGKVIPGCLDESWRERIKSVSDVPSSQDLQYECKAHNIERCI